MSIDPKLLLSNFPAISVILGLLIIGKTMLVTFIGRVFGISTIAAVWVGLLLAPGGEFAFVAFGEAVNQVWPWFFLFFCIVLGDKMYMSRTSELRETHGQYFCRVFYLLNYRHYYF